MKPPLSDGFAAAYPPSWTKKDFSRCVTSGIKPETLTRTDVLTALAEDFAALPASRSGPASRHDLLTLLLIALLILLLIALLILLLIALLTLICGGEGFTDMERFARAKQTWLRERPGLSLVGGIPAHDTFGRFFASVWFASPA